MIYLQFLLLIALFTPNILSAHSEIPGEPQRKPIALTNATIVTITKGVIENATIVFEKGKITKIGTDVTIPENTEIINCQGQYVFPGFITASTTLGLVEIDAVRATRDMNEVGLYNPNVKAETAYNPESELIPTIRTNGVLIANIVPEGGFISGQGSFLALDGWNKEDAMIQSKSCMKISIPDVTIAPWMKNLEKEAEIKADIEKKLQEFLTYIENAHSYSLLAKEGLSKGNVDLRYESLRAIFEKQQVCFIEANSYQQLLIALEIIRRYNLRAVLSTGNEVIRCLDQVKALQVGIVIPRIHSLPDKDEDTYDQPFTLPQQLQKKGILFAFSESGSWQQRNLPFNAGTAVGFGLEEMEALKGLTLYPAMMFGVDSLVGSLDIGKEATLFVSQGNPLDYSTNNVTMAFIKGRKMSIENRNTRLAKKYRSRYTQLRMEEIYNLQNEKPSKKIELKEEITPQDSIKTQKLTPENPKKLQWK